MFEHYTRHNWVLPLYQYETRDQLIAALGEHVIEPAEGKALVLRSGARPIPPILIFPRGEKESVQPPNASAV